MQIEQIYTGCLAQGAYYITSHGEAAIIDPLREIKPYLQRAEKDGVKIKYIFETHFHADFVSGHLDLSKATGAPIVFGPGAAPVFDAYIAKDQEVFNIGDISIQAVHTPGHTMESTCYLLRDASGKEIALFSGDTLFIGDVGRPDLAQKAAELTRDDLAGMLFDSLRDKILPLPDDIIVYPGHGAGSACGKKMSSETTDTLGQQKQFNYALRADMTRAEFIKEVTDGLAPPPGYFPFNVKMNKEGYQNLDHLIEQSIIPLGPEAFEAAAEESGALILDTRKPEDFVKGFIPNSINIGINGGFAPWVGTLITDIHQPLLLVTDPGKEEETIIRLARVGYENVKGYLEGGIEAWKNTGKQTDQIASVSAAEFEKRMNDAPLTVVDVRKFGEFETSRLADAVNLPLDFINDEMASFPKDQPFFIHCAGGYRSVIASSILKSRGYDNMINVEGGFGAITKTGLQIETGPVSHEVQ
jgi:hydroxyacylglutathione hydrolase